MAAYRTPGVYYQSVDAGGLPVTPFRTDIAGFVGLAERGPLDTAVPLESWQQFTSWFGSFTTFGFLAYAVRAFFENGGRRCWAVRVGVASTDLAAGAQVASAVVSGAGSGPALRVQASTPGGWGDGLTFTVRERNRAQTFASHTEPDGTWSTVPDVSGLGRSVLVRLTQEGAATVEWRVISGIDAVDGRVFWVHPDHASRLPSDRPVRAFDSARPVLVQSVDYTIAVSERSRLVRLYERLSTVPSHARYAPSVLPVPNFPEGRVDAHNPTPPEPIAVDDLAVDASQPSGLDVDPFRTISLSGGRDGLMSLEPGDFYGEPFLPDDNAVVVGRKRRGMRVLEGVDEIAMLAVPDAQPRPIELHPFQPPPPCIPDPCVDEEPPPAVTFAPRVPEQPPMFGDDALFRIQSELVLQCERLGYRFALLDPPFDSAHGSLPGIRAVLDWRARFDSAFAALYFPWVRVVDPLRPGSGALRSIPPCGYVAGGAAATDLAIGVHKAPANRAVGFAHDASLNLSDEHHGTLNSCGVNAIRISAAGGLRVLGARTVSSDPDWRYVNVRRLMSMIEKALESGLQWVVFEPNGFLTRARVTMSVTLFLLSLHEAGMLAGGAPEESFLVRCDLDNNPQAQRDLGELLVEFSVAPAKPFEFVVVRVGRVGGALEVSEVESRVSYAGAGAS